MSIKRTAFIICDRCEKVINEVSADKQPDTPCFILRHQLGTDLEANGNPATSGFEFRHLCNKCDTRVKNLLEMIEMKTTEATTKETDNGIDEEPPALQDEGPLPSHPEQ